MFRSGGGRRIALRLREDGRLETDGVRPGRASRDPRKLFRWIAAPAHPNEPRLFGSARLGRARHLIRRFGDRRLSKGGGAPIGWLRGAGGPSCRPIFSASHPVTGDQLLTCSPDEALAHGYFLDGDLGFILDAGSARMPSATSRGT